MVVEPSNTTPSSIRKLGVVTVPLIMAGGWATTFSRANILPTTVPDIITTASSIWALTSALSRRNDLPRQYFLKLLETASAVAVILLVLLVGPLVLYERVRAKEAKA